MLYHVSCMRHAATQHLCTVGCEAPVFPSDGGVVAAVHGSVAATGKMGDDLEGVVFRDRVNLRGLGDYYRETEECDHH